MPAPLRPISATTSPARSAGRRRAAPGRPPYRTTRRAPRPPLAGRRRRRDRGGRRAAARQLAGAAPGVAHRQRQRRPAGQPAELDDRRRDRRGRQHLGRGADHQRAAAAGDEHHAVGVLHDALEPVLGHQHGDAEVVHQPLQHGEHVLGRGRVEGGGRLVEDEDARVRGEHRADGDALLLAGGQRGERPVAQPGEAEQVERVLDPAAHRVGGDAEVLHRVGELVLDGVGDEAGERVLADVPDDVGELARRCSRVSRPSTVTRPVSSPPVKCGTRPLTARSSVDLPGAGAPDDQAQLALGHVQVDAGEDRRVGAGVGDRDLLEGDHAGLLDPGGRRRAREVGGARLACPAGARPRPAARRPAGRRRYDRQPGATSGEVDGAPRPGRARRDSAAAATSPPRGHTHSGRPRVGPVAGAGRAAAAEGEPRGDDGAGGQHRQAEDAAPPASSRPYRPAHSPAARPAQRAGAPARARVVGAAAVAAGVHRRRQLDRALQRAFEDRHRDAPQPAQPGVGRPRSRRAARTR